MVKSILLKIILAFSIIGIFLITGIGIYNMLEINELMQINADNPELIQSLKYNLNESAIITSVAVSLYAVLSILIAILVTKAIVVSLNNLMIDAQKIPTGDNEQIDYKLNRKNKTEIDSLIEKFNAMTNNLRNNLTDTIRQKRQIETILEHMTDGIIAFDLNGDILHINPAATRLLKLMPEDNNFDKIFQKLDLQLNMEKIIYLENWTSSEQKVDLKDRFVNMFFAPFKDENDKPAGIIVVVQDITEHVKLDNMRKEFVADVSHELKTPITSIMGYADTLQEGEYEKEIQEKFLNVISTEARRMARLVNDLLTLFKYDRDEVKWQKTEFDLGELVKSCEEKLKLEIEKKKQKTECFVTANVPRVYADKYGIERVILNILTNSIKYTKEGGSIKIYVGFVYNDAYIKIIDNGIGIPKEDLSKIFERFYRVDKSRTREMGGTGLGLSIAKEILDKNEGSIDIKSEVGKGTEVVIKIPTANRKELS